MGSPSRSNHSNPTRRGSGSGAPGDGGKQQTLSDKDEGKPQKVFISFHYADRSKVALMQAQAENSENLEFKDVSLKEEVKSNDWKPEAKKQIAKSDQVIVAVGEETSERKAVKWEIEEAKRQGKPIVPVRLNSDAEDPLPENVKEKDAVDWKLKDIQKEIDKNEEEQNDNKTKRAGEK
jgi:hypothetical protein